MKKNLSENSRFFFIFVHVNEIYKKLTTNKINSNLIKYFKKSHFIPQKLIFHCLKKKNVPKKSRFLLFTRTFRTSGTCLVTLFYLNLAWLSRKIFSSFTRLFILLTMINVGWYFIFYLYQVVIPTDSFSWFVFIVFPIILYRFF